MALTRESHIHGNGFGSSHAWRNFGTGPSRCTLYICSDCGARFGHHYPSVPDIFKALAKSGIPDQCPGLPPLPAKDAP